MTSTAGASTGPGSGRSDHGPTHPHEHDHPHDHEHPHDHADPAAGEHNPTSSGAGSVIVDVGGDVGAAVVITPESLLGREIEIRPAADDWDGTHVAVIPRHVGSTTIHAALFPGLTAGHYQVRERFGPPNGVVVDLEVVGGSVQRFTWPEG